MDDAEGSAVDRMILAMYTTNPPEVLATRHLFVRLDWHRSPPSGPPTKAPRKRPR